MVDTRVGAIWLEEQEQAKAEADPYGMTNKRTGNGNGKYNCRSPAGMTNETTSGFWTVLSGI
jgi:hypothetical protein